MIPAPLSLLALPLFTALSAPASPGPELAIAFAGNSIQAKVSDTSPDFLAAVILSDQDQLTHYLAVVPPLLSNFVILAVGQAQDGAMKVVVPHGALPPVDTKVYGQGVTLDLGSLQLASSKVESLVLPAAH